MPRDESVEMEAIAARAAAADEKLDALLDEFGHNYDNAGAIVDRCRAKIHAHVAAAYGTLNEGRTERARCSDGLACIHPGDCQDTCLLLDEPRAPAPERTEQPEPLYAVRTCGAGGRDHFHIEYGGMELIGGTTNDYAQATDWARRLNAGEDINTVLARAEQPGERERP